MLKYFEYYGSLSSDWQIIFINRVLRFVNTKEIIGAEGFNVNNKVKAIIAASAVQLTLGLETWELSYFDVIIIHPKEYLNTNTNLWYKGETNLKGFIRLSWTSFIYGYKYPHDNVNLGIHEFSHAMLLNGFKGDEQDYHMEYFYLKWLAAAHEAHFHIKQGKQNVFREYGGANMSEFLSVCIEHFFESPHEIQLHYPHLYYNTAILLNQHFVGGKTFLNVREKLMIEKNNFLEDLQPIKIKQNVFSSTSFSLIVITLLLLLITALNAGLFSGPSIFLSIIAFFFYLRLDYYYIRINAINKEIEFMKGLFFFKRMRQRKILLSQLVNCSYNVSGSMAELTFIYYHFKDRFFYEEEIECNIQDIGNLIIDLKHNKISVKKN